MSATIDEPVKKWRRTMETAPPHALNLLIEVRQHPEMSNRELAALCDMSQRNVHEWKRTFSHAGLITRKKRVDCAHCTPTNEPRE